MKEQGDGKRPLQTRETMSTVTESRTFTTFSSSQAIELIDGLTWRMLDHWTSQGVLSVPNPTPGKGTPREFTFNDLVALQTLTVMRRWGVNLNALREVANFIRHLDDLNVVHTYLSVTSAGITVIESDGCAVSTETLMGNQPVGWVIDLGAIVHALGSKVEHYVVQRSA